MKTIKTFAFIAFLLFLFPVEAQNTAHSTINDFSVSYKSIPNKTNTTTTLGFKVIPQATITITPNANISKIYFKILSQPANAIIYQVDYSINASVITDPSGFTLFKSNKDILFISNGQELDLQPYKYEITTEDAKGNLSTVFSTIK